jgi:hypothetical protein
VLLLSYNTECACGGMVDAPASGAGIREGVWVRIPPRAQIVSGDERNCSSPLFVFHDTIVVLADWIECLCQNTILLLLRI